MRPFPGIGLLLLSGACGGPSPDAPINAPIGIASVAPPPTTTAPPTTVTTVAEQPTHGPSRELVRRWPMKQSEVLIYADLAGFTSTDLGRATAKAMASAFKGGTMTKCFAGAIGLKELAFGFDDVGGLIVARFDKDPSADLETCMDAVDSDYVPQKNVAGAKKAWGRGGSEGLVVDGNFAIFGTMKLVERTLATNAADDGTLASLRLTSDQFLMWQGKVHQFETHGSFTANKQRVLVDGQIDFNEEDDAKRMEQRESPGKLANEIGRAAERFDKGAWAIVNKIAGATRMRREDKHVSITFELVGSPDDQAKDITPLAALGVRGFEYEMTRNRAYAANSGIYRIQSAMQVWAMNSNPRPKKLVSLPAVPKTIPKGTKTVLTKADWKSWSSINYAEEGGTRYQFEVKASKTGDSAEIFARGDLDGNGKSSLYKMDVRLGANGELEFPGGIAETDPQE